MESEGEPVSVDVQEVVETYHDMEFDEPLADELFALTPPAGYAVATVGTPPADRKEILVEPPVATPDIGIGPLKFDMPRAEIVRLLGKPGAEDTHVPQFTVSHDITRLDDKERPNRHLVPSAKPQGDPNSRRDQTRDALRNANALESKLCVLVVFVG